LSFAVHRSQGSILILVRQVVPELFPHNSDKDSHWISSYTPGTNRGGNEVSKVRFAVRKPLRSDSLTVELLK
jgi:hypothetical protein